MRFLRIFFNKSSISPNSDCLFFIKIFKKVVYLTRKYGMEEPTEIYKKNKMILNCWGQWGTGFLQNDPWILISLQYLI